MLEIKKNKTTTKTVTEMKNDFDGLISKLDMAKGRTSELEDIVIETSKNEKQTEQN